MTMVKLATQCIMDAQGPWSHEESTKSSTWRELRAVRLVLEALEFQLSNERVRWFTNNQNVVCILSVGSRKPDLQEEALAIFFNLPGMTHTHRARVDP